MTENIRVKLENGKVTVSKDPAEANKGEKVVWSCNLPFAVCFKKSPFYQLRLQWQKKVVSDYKAEESVIWDPAKGGSKHFWYSVAVYNPDDDKVYFLDPGLVVPRQPPGP